MLLLRFHHAVLLYYYYYYYYYFLNIRDAEKKVAWACYRVHTLTFWQARRRRNGMNKSDGLLNDARYCYNDLVSKPKVKVHTINIRMYLFFKNPGAEAQVRVSVPKGTVVVVVCRVYTKNWVLKIKNPRLILLRPLASNEAFTKRSR